MTLLRRCAPFLLFGLAAACALWLIFGMDANALKFTDADIQAFREASDAERKRLMLEYAKDDPAAAWALLKEAAFTEEGGTHFGTHDLAHIAGNGLFRAYGMEGISRCDDSFTFGCRHGVSEAFLLEYGPEHTADIARACAGVQGCIHGIGHGLATWEAYDLPSALSYCDLLDPARRIYCYDGVYMETFQSTEPDADGDPWETCARAGSPYLERCARYLSFALEKLRPGDYSAIADICMRGPIGEARENCARSIGYRAAWGSLGSYEGIARFCGAIADGSARDLCIAGAARETAIQPYTDAEGTARALCESLDDADASLCLAILESDPYHP